MQIDIVNPQLETAIFSLLFLTVIIFTAKKTHLNSGLDFSKTQELKGFAILAVIFSHIGYYLFKDHLFLFPLSILAGVGVNLFLFLSGFGLTLSNLKSESALTVSSSYQITYSFFKNQYIKRLKKLFLPLWIVLTLLIVCDLLFLHQGYTSLTLFQSFLGFFPKANLYQDINSPLWYFSLIFYYYLLFPLCFWNKKAYLAPLVILIISYLLLQLPIPVDVGVLGLYKLHFTSFPLGVLFALLYQDKNLTTLKLKLSNIFLKQNLKYVCTLILISIFVYTSFNSGVGLNKTTEQVTSIITMFSLIFIFMFKTVDLGLLNIFGKYSYQIYLIHWPILYRYDLFYKYLPASVATLVYLGFFLALGYLLDNLIKRFA